MARARGRVTAQMRQPLMAASATQPASMDTVLPALCPVPSEVGTGAPSHVPQTLVQML